MLLLWESNLVTLWLLDQTCVQQMYEMHGICIPFVKHDCTYPRACEWSCSNYTGVDIKEVQEIVETHLKDMLLKHFDPKKADSIFSDEGAVSCCTFNWYFWSKVISKYGASLNLGLHTLHHYCDIYGMYKCSNLILKKL